MKLHPPAVTVDDQAPFEEALFNRDKLAKSLTMLLKNVEESLVVFIHAPWGEGKTTFAKMWQAYLRSQKIETIYFDAYASDYFDDPFVSFSGEILDLVNKHLPKTKSITIQQEFKKSAMEVGKRLAGLSAKIGLRALTLGAVESAHLGELKKIGTELATGVADIGAEIIEKRIEHYTTEKNILQSFKENLAKLAAVVREEQGFPLTIIVDELDRCRPDFALGLLERIKHLFDIKDIAFILLVNRDQIESYVRTVYGASVDARAYLLKFANLFTDLPNQPITPGERGQGEFCQWLFLHFDFSIPNEERKILERSVIVFVRHFDLTLREIERVFALFTLHYGSLTKNQPTNGMLVALLATLKVKQPTLYRSLAMQSINARDFFAKTKLDQLEGNNVTYRTRILEIINYCLDKELMKVPNEMIQRLDNYWQFRHGIERHQIIPLFCKRFDCFSLQPPNT